MREVTDTLISSLQKCDTTKVLVLFEASASHINQENYRTFLKENILTDCSWYNKITGKYGLPNLDKLSFTKNPQTQANIAVLPLLQTEDSALNLKSSTLFVEFYPDQFFNGRILSFTVSREILKKKQTLKAPPVKPK